MPGKLLIVFVHGWSVTSTETYGGLPARLRLEAQNRGVPLLIKEIFLGRYISFHDEVRLGDISRAFETAVKDTLGDILGTGIRFVCITHSTGGPAIRDWYHRYYLRNPLATTCPMSHLIMLAPANHGSALAQLGKSRISRLRSWFKGVEPGQGVLDWLELGSSESWDLNLEWILHGERLTSSNDIFPFVLTSQSIDRSFVDNLNTYTGETGSDGVVRTASANLNDTYIRLEQEPPRAGSTGKNAIVADKLEVASINKAPGCAFRLIAAKSHVGPKMGIMESVKPALDDTDNHEVVDAIFCCMQVDSTNAYQSLCEKFAAETAAIHARELIEIDQHHFRADTCFVHDRCSMVIFRVYDDENHPVTDYDLILLAGKKSDPNHLPRNFFIDRQRNRISPGMITYYFNYDVMKGCAEVRNSKGDTVIREASPGADGLGIRIIARPDSGFVHYLPCEIKASKTMLDAALHPDCTTLIEIKLRRIVHKNVFRLEKMPESGKPVDFRKTVPGEGVAG